MNPLYNIGISLYGAAARLASLQSKKVSDMIAGQRATLNTLESERLTKAPDGYDVWIHAASLGEFEQGRPLIERLRREHPEKKILLTFFSPSGYNVRRNYDRVDTVAYLPFDTPAKVKRFLDAAKPKMAIFVKYEFWGNYLEQLHRRGIPTYLISSIFRPSQRFFRPGGEWARNMLRKFNHLYLQDEASRKLLAGIGIENTTVAGDTRFDRVTDIMRMAKEVKIAGKFTENAKFTLIAGSSWPADEDIYIPWIKANPQVKAIIAPHEFDKERLGLLRKRFAGKAVLLSELQFPSDLNGDEQVLIIDCFGLLSSLYNYGSVAYIGGGFGAGIHNINEAAVFGIPVVFGPRHHKFKEASDLIACGGGFEINNREECTRVLDNMLNNPDARHSAGEAAADYIRHSIGATDLIYDDLFPKS